MTANAIPRLPKDVIEEVRARSRLITALALAYTFGGYAVAVALMLQPGVLRVAGALLAAHTMLVSLYLQHDAAHGLVLERARSNAAIGYLLSWLTGAAYFRFETYQKVHLQHHRFVCDLESFSTRRFLESATPWSRLVSALERAYFPMLHFHIRIRGIGQSFTSGTTRDRARIAFVTATRVGGFAALAVVSPWAALAAFVAYLVFVHVNRFVDAFQHTYREHETTKGVTPGTLEEEMARTFTLPVIGGPASVFGLALLYFNLHNAHHFEPNAPWYRLPRLHAHLYGTAERPGLLPEPPTATIGQLVAAYHQHRVNRLIFGQGQASTTGNRLGFERFYGAFTDKLGLPLEE
ncbi:fatty acid desaturase [Myxococcota bacterium]|nr:fatty acid desaturase [Myxococcota bacterium]